MTDFEVMPIGTQDVIRETAELLRSYERHHREIAAKTGARTGRQEKAQRNADAAARLEALLVIPPAICHVCEGRGVYDSKPIPPDTGPAMEFECYACNGTGRSPGQITTDQEEREHNGGFTVAEEQATCAHEVQTTATTGDGVRVVTCLECGKQLGRWSFGDNEQS